MAMSLNSRGLLLILSLMVSAVSGYASAQSAYPNRPIRLICPSTPGTGTDVTARLIAQGLSERMGQAVVVENRTGANNIIGGELAAKAPADGYTLHVTGSTLAINPAMYKKMPYDALRDFRPVTQAVSVPSLMVVHPSLPAKNVKELIALARARPGEINYGTTGPGTNAHLSTALFDSMAKVRMTHVPYRTSNTAFVDLVGGRIEVMIANMIQAIPEVRAGRVRALGVTSARRSTAAPDIPTVAESGLPGYESVQWYGLLVPAGTPREIVARLHKETVATLETPKSRQVLSADGAEVIASLPEEFAAFLKAETVKWAKAVKDAGIQPE